MQAVGSSSAVASLGTDDDAVLVLGRVAAHEERVGSRLLQEVEPGLLHPAHAPPHRLHDGRVEGTGAGRPPRPRPAASTGAGRAPGPPAAGAARTGRPRSCEARRSLPLPAASFAGEAWAGQGAGRRQRRQRRRRPGPALAGDWDHRGDHLSRWQGRRRWGGGADLGQVVTGHHGSFPRAVLGLLAHAHLELVEAGRGVGVVRRPVASLTCW